MPRPSPTALAIYAAAHPANQGGTMKRTRRGNITVSTSYLDPVTDDETDIEVECLVTPGEPEIRWGDNAHPGCGPEVEIVSAEGSDGKDYREAIEADARWFDRVCDDAIEAAGDAADDDDRAYDEARDRRAERD